MQSFSCTCRHSPLTVVLRMVKCDAIILQIFTFTVSLKTTLYTEAARMSAKFQVTSSTESNDRAIQVPHSPIPNSLSFALVPNEMNQHWGFSMEQFESQKPISQEPRLFRTTERNPVFQVYFLWRHYFTALLPHTDQRAIMYSAVNKPTDLCEHVWEGEAGAGWLVVILWHSWWGCPIEWCTQVYSVDIVTTWCGW